MDFRSLSLLWLLQCWVASTTDLFLTVLEAKKFHDKGASMRRFGGSFSSWLAEGRLLTVSSHDMKGEKEIGLSCLFL